MYCTIPYYTIQNVSHDHSNTKLDRFMWYTTFWPPMSANSKMVRYFFVAVLVFKWAAKIFIVYFWAILFVWRAGSIPPYAVFFYWNSPLTSSEEQLLLILQYRVLQWGSLNTGVIVLHTIRFMNKIIDFYRNEKVQVAYGHPPSRSCGGLEGPFGPCWEPLAPS